MRCAGIALALLVALAAACSSEPALLRQIHKEELIEAIEQALRASVEAGMSAVLSTGDEESLEQRMDDLSAQVERNLAAARASDALSPELLATASSAWGRAPPDRCRSAAAFA